MDLNIIICDKNSVPFPKLKMCTLHTAHCTDQAVHQTNKAKRDSTLNANIN